MPNNASRSVGAKSECTLERTLIQVFGETVTFGTKCAADCAVFGRCTAPSLTAEDAFNFTAALFDYSHPPGMFGIRRSKGMPAVCLHVVSLGFLFVPSK